jgi:purine-binding chemotaxis protein CheW
MSSEKKLCTFVLDELLLGIEVEQVQEVIRYQHMTLVPLAAGVIAGLINLRGQIVTAIDLRLRLGLPHRSSEQLPMNVVIRTEDGPLSLLVDEIREVVEVDDTSFEPVPETLTAVDRELIRGVYKLKHDLLLMLHTARAVDVASVANV